MVSLKKHPKSFCLNFIVFSVRNLFLFCFYRFSYDFSFIFLLLVTKIMINTFLKTLPTLSWEESYTFSSDMAIHWTFVTIGAIFTIANMNFIFLLIELRKVMLVYKKASCCHPQMIQPNTHTHSHTPIPTRLSLSIYIYICIIVCESV